MYINHGMGTEICRPVVQQYALSTMNVRSVISHPRALPDGVLHVSLQEQYAGNCVASVTQWYNCILQKKYIYMWCNCGSWDMSIQPYWNNGI